MPSTAELEAALRGADLRVTGPRLAVLDAVHAHPHADTHTLARVVGTAHGDVSRQAVYDVLHAFTDAGLVRRIQPPGSPARYESRVADNHHHLVCRACGRVEDVDCAVGAAPCLTPAATHGFVLDEAEVVHLGLCPTCAAPAARPDPPHPRGAPCPALRSPTPSKAR